MRKHLPYTFLIFFLLTGIAAESQNNPQPYAIHYGTEDGLPSPETYCVMKDSKGYMWFGTDNGAARFDGYEFKTYGPREGLMSNVIFDIHEDVRGRIWFGTMTGEAFILEKDSIYPYPYNDLVTKHFLNFKKASLSHLEIDGTVYFELVPSAQNNE